MIEVKCYKYEKMWIVDKCGKEIERINWVNIFWIKKKVLKFKIMKIIVL